MVRSQTTANLVGAKCISFWTALGFAVKYELVKQGQTFQVCHSDHELTVCVTMASICQQREAYDRQNRMYTPVKMQIQLCSVHPSIQHQQHSEEGVADVCNMYWLCQLSAETRGSHAADAANAVGMSMRNAAETCHLNLPCFSKCSGLPGTFSKLLEPMVEFKKL